MLRKSAAVLAIVLSLSNLGAARADPGPVVNWLMNEPVSLFDLGMMRLTRQFENYVQHILGNQKGEQLELFPSVDYDWAKNRIRMVLAFVTKAPVEKIRQLCNPILQDIRRKGGVDPNTGGLMQIITSSLYSTNFSHLGYMPKAEPSGYLNKLDEIIEIKVVVSSKKETAACFGPLLSNKVYFEE